MPKKKTPAKTKKTTAAPKKQLVSKELHRVHQLAGVVFILLAITFGLLLYIYISTS